MHTPQTCTHQYIKLHASIIQILTNLLTLFHGIYSHPSMYLIAWIDHPFPELLTLIHTSHSHSSMHPSAFSFAHQTIPKTIYHNFTPGVADGISERRTESARVFCTPDTSPAPLTHPRRACGMNVMLMDDNSSSHQPSGRRHD